MLCCAMLCCQQQSSLTTQVLAHHDITYTGPVEYGLSPSVAAFSCDVVGLKC